MPLPFTTRIRSVSRHLFYDSSQRFSLGLASIVFGLLNLWLLVWFFVAWIVYVTKYRLLGEAAPLVAAIGTPVATVLGGQFAAIVGTYAAKLWLSGKQYQADTVANVAGAPQASAPTADAPPDPTAAPDGGTL